MTTTVYDNPSGINLPEFCDENCGFPFDESEDRGLRSRLDDIAQRHPEFADHLNPETWGRRRASSSSGTSEDPFARFRNRSRFQDFPNFPFDEFDDPRLFDRYHQQPETSQTYSKASPQQQSQQSQSQEQVPSDKVFEKPPHPKANNEPTEGDSIKKPHIQLSNTVDLGQPQEPVVDATRTQRSMSAPPDQRNTATGKRYVSSINIPNVNADMGGSMSQQQAPQPQGEQPHTQNPKERIIPIHIEGRDEPVIPRNVHTQNQSGQQPQAERIFGQRPGIFTQYVNPTQHEQTQDDLKQQEQLRRQQQQEKYQEYQRQQQQQQQQEHQQQQHQQQQQHKQHQFPPPSQEQAPSAKPSSLELIQNIQKDVSALMSQVEQFDGKPRDKQYLYLDEMLTRKMLLLDDIETGGQDAIRKARKEAIKCIQDTIKVLDNKAQANEEKKRAAAAAIIANIIPEVMETETATTDKDQTPTKEKTPDNKELLVGGVSRSGSQIAIMDVEQVPPEVENVKDLEAGDAPKSVQTEEPEQVDKSTNTEKVSEKDAKNASQEKELHGNDIDEPNVQEKNVDTKDAKAVKETGNEKKKVKKKVEKK